MAYKGKIITVGISPAWDVQFVCDELDWGDHRQTDSYSEHAAGKALNISKALSWFGYGSVAAGLWGARDYDDMLSNLRPYTHCLDIRFTTVPGRTRRNVSVFDSKRHRELHLRVPGELATKGNLKKLTEQLVGQIDEGDLCVFAGTMPEDSLSDDIVDMVWACRQKGARIILDSSGAAFRKLYASQLADIISPNLLELSELVGSKVKEDIESAARAAKKLLGNVKNVLVSLGADGAILVNKEGLWHSRFTGTPLSLRTTVGCGDHLLAGFIAGRYEDDDYAYALEKAVMCASANAFGLTSLEPWEVKEKLEIETVFYNY
jgi:1-phosphofructokinase family hexose kinase